MTENISFEVDTWRNGDAEQGVNISGLAGGADLGQLAFTNGIILEDNSRKTGTVAISWNPTNGASFTTTGLTTNADFSEVDTGAFVANDEHNFIISARVGGANEDLFIDNLVIAVAGTDDADGDGLPDYWEEKYGVDDPEGDPDNDGLTNIEEFELRTKPDMADSDEDGLSDKAEIEVHETNPLNPDADRDGLLDGEEIAAGTDPDNRDTDGDGISDFNEIQDGTDPLVVTAIAFETNLVSYWPLDSDFDDAKAENHGVEEGGPIEFQTGKFDGAIYLNGSQSIAISGDENTFDFAGESFTVSAWYTAEAINKSWQCLVAKGEGNGWRVHRRGGDNPPEMTFTGGNGDVDRHNVAMTVGGDPETWHLSLIHI